MFDNKASAKKAKQKKKQTISMSSLKEDKKAVLKKPFPSKYFKSR